MTVLKKKRVQSANNNNSDVHRTNGKLEIVRRKERRVDAVDAKSEEGWMEYVLNKQRITEISTFLIHADLSVYLFVYQSVRLPVYLSVCLSACPPVCLSPSACFPLCLLSRLYPFLVFFLCLCPTAAPVRVSARRGGAFSRRRQVTTRSIPDWSFRQKLSRDIRPGVSRARARARERTNERTGEHPATRVTRVNLDTRAASGVCGRRRDRARKDRQCCC